MRLYKLEFTYFDSVTWGRITKTVITDSLEQLKESVDEELEFQYYTEYTFENFKDSIKEVELPIIYYNKN